MNKRIVPILAIVLSSLSSFGQKIVGMVLNGDSTWHNGCTVVLSNFTIKKL